MNRSSRARALATDRRGVAALEFALTAPMLLLIVLGVSDLVMWLRTWLLMDQSAYATAQVVTQYNNLYTSDFSSVFMPVATAGVGGASLSCGAGGMVVTGISNTNGTPSVGWQWSSGSCVTSSYTSNGSPHLPAGYAPSTGNSAIVVELTTTQPAFVFSAGLLKTTGLSTIHTYSVVMPRNVSLPSYTSGTRPSS